MTSCTEPTAGSRHTGAKLRATGCEGHARESSIDAVDPSLSSLSARGWPWLRRFAVDEPHGNDDAVLESFFREYLEAAFRLEPMMATRLGDHRFDDQLDDLSAPGRKARLDHDREALADLSRKINYEKLSRDGQIDYEILRQSPRSDRSGWPRRSSRSRTTRASTAITSPRASTCC